MRPTVGLVSSAGWVIAAVVTLVLGYLVPTLIKRRQGLHDARGEDRYSRRLRVVERPSSPDHSSVSPSTRPLVAVSSTVLGHRAVSSRGEESTVNRPTGMPSPRAAARAQSAAAARAALAARRSRQRAAARRRLVLVLALLAVTAVVWLAVGLAGFSPLLAALPTLVLAVTVVMGIRTAQAEQAEWAAIPAHLRPAPAAVSAASAGRRYTAAQLREHLPEQPAIAPAGARTESAATEGVGADPVGEAPASPTAGLRWQTDALTEELPALEEEAEPVAERQGWTPVPVPVPTYTLKPPARRREVAPAATGEDVTEPAQERADETHPTSDATAQAAPEAEEAPGIDLHAVLARRRSKSA